MVWPLIGSDIVLDCLTCYYNDLIFGSEHYPHLPLEYLLNIYITARTLIGSENVLDFLSEHLEYICRTCLDCIGSDIVL